MKGKVINEKQPFGVVNQSHMHRETAYRAPVRNSTGALSEVYNNGISAAISNADKAPNAHARASQHRDNPFAFTGMPSTQSHNSFNPRMQISETPS